jgi:hypothetical protein
MQLAPIRVECVFLEEIAQVANPWDAPPTVGRGLGADWKRKNKPSARKMSSECQASFPLPWHSRREERYRGDAEVGASSALCPSTASSGHDSGLGGVRLRPRAAIEPDLRLALVKPGFRWSRST